MAELTNHYDFSELDSGQHKIAIKTQEGIELTISVLNGRTYVSAPYGYGFINICLGLKPGMFLVTKEE